MTHPSHPYGWPGGAAYPPPFPLHAYAPAAGAGAVLGWPAGFVGGQLPPDAAAGNAAALLGLEWALEEADFGAARIPTPRAGAAGAFGLQPGQVLPAGFGAPPPAPPPVWPPPAPGDAPRLRCLDSSHVAPCSRCTAAPPREAVAYYNLVGDPGRKNGEKKLKHQILRTPEWASPHARATLAESCDREGFTALAHVLRGDATSAALRKADFLHLTRSWNYASDVWKPCPPRGERAGTRAPRRPRKR